MSKHAPEPASPESANAESTSTADDAFGVAAKQGGPNARTERELLEHRLTLLRRPYSDDTTPEAQRMLNQIVREMPEEKRAQRFSIINHFARERMIEGFQHRNPALTRREAELNMIRAQLGEDLFRRAYGDRRDERS